MSVKGVIKEVGFFTKKIGKSTIVKVDSKTFNCRCVKKLANKMKQQNIALDCTGIDILSETAVVELIIENNIALCNACAGLIQQISLLNTKKFPRLYMSSDDFINNKRMLIRRKFVAI